MVAMMDAPHRVYFIRAKNGLVKIGYSRSIDERETFHREWSPVPLKLVACAVGGRRSEAYIHRLLKPWRSHGEWFFPNARLTAIIKHVRAHGVLPEDCGHPIGPDPVEALTGRSGHSLPRHRGAAMVSRCGG